MEIQDICLAEIAPSKMNSRKSFFGPKYDELMESIRNKGVQQPIIIRTVEGKSKAYEIVAGERRWRACCDIARENGGITKHSIPAIIRTMTDEDAFDAMLIENMHREDISPLEQAKGFKAYLKRHKGMSVQDLAARVGVDPRQINRVMGILDLPDVMLRAWDEGVIEIGHLEILRTLDPGAREQIFIEVCEDGLSVREFRNQVSKISVSLSLAKFDKTECMACNHNSDVSVAMFGEIVEGAMCRNQECFAEKQMAHINANWDAFKKKHELSGTDRSRRSGAPGDPRRGHREEPHGAVQEALERSSCAT